MVPCSHHLQFLLLFQAVAISSSRSSVQSYNWGIYTFLSSLALAGTLLAQDTGNASAIWHGAPSLLALRAAELVSAVCLAFAGVSIPRRPDVFYNGELVDRMLTVSAFSRFNWSWPYGILDVATRKRDLDIADLTRPDHCTRAKDTSDDWKRRNYHHPLWLSVLRAHKAAFALQWALTVCTAILNFAPQWVILQLLRGLENRKPGTDHGLDIWVWVIWLGVVIVAQSWVESYVFWLSWSGLTIPVRAQLSSLIFEKAMRRKDVKGTGKQKKEEAPEPEASEPTAGGQPDPVQEDASEQLKKSNQSTVNLIGVDGKRVSDFLAYTNLFPGSLFKLIVSLTFLAHLLGWKALLVGFSSMLAIMPVNIYFSKRYSAAQDRLMKARDEKMEVVTEALQGIRQIKFSALEPEWENKIGSVREKELTAVWDVFMSDTALLGCWVTSPILLSALSLAVYAYLNGSLAPSVAFVSLGVFRALEFTLSVIPELTTDLLDAWVSIQRIEEYLCSPEVTKISKDSHEVSFDNASIAWPSDQEVGEEERFVLRNVNVTFPTGELSVISGKTGAGKSLMLAAILGEVDLLEGTLYVPRSPPLSSRFDHKANSDNWILPGAVAYVAQIPWIENASIRDNITFGLPFDEERYLKTVEVCALKKDLEMLTDGENTEIGANGINLSGGQKWRVTLARAIYSRAGILVLDDIFSAVDAHVGRHIFEKCLNGELAAGRTRILVTHHVALCEPKTKYLVELGDGGVLHAGLLSDLREEGTLQQIKSHEQAPEEIEAEEASTAVGSNDSIDGEDEQSGANGEPLSKVASKSAARKFVEDETREQGAVQKRVYLKYLEESGGFFFWTFALVVFALVQVFNLGEFHPFSFASSQTSANPRCRAVMVAQDLDRRPRRAELHHSACPQRHSRLWTCIHLWHPADVYSLPDRPVHPVRVQPLVLSGDLCGASRHVVSHRHSQVPLHLHRLCARKPQAVCQAQLHHPPGAHSMARHGSGWQDLEPIHWRFPHYRFTNGQLCQHGNELMPQLGRSYHCRSVRVSIHCSAGWYSSSLLPLLRDPVSERGPAYQAARKHIKVASIRAVRLGPHGRGNNSRLR